MEVFTARLREVMERRGLSDQQVADMVTEQTGMTMTRVYISLLRSGKQKNPTVARLKALAQVLEVRPSYLLGEADPADDAPFASLSNESRNALRYVLELARRADRLPPVNWNGPGEPTMPRPAIAEPSASQGIHHPFTLEQVQQAFASSIDRTPPNRVGGRLRDLRKVAGLSAAEADLVVGGEPGLVEDIEAGSTTPSTAMLRTLLTRYGVGDSHQQELFVSAAAGKLDTRWWFPYFQRLPLWLVTYLEMEDSATQVRMYSDATIPALLQHEDYAVAMRRSAHFPEIPADQIELGIEILRERQQRLLDERPVKLWAVLQESVLLDDLGGTEVQLRQIDHLMELAARPHITIQINRGGPDRYRPRGGAFSLIRLPDDGVLDVVWIPQLSDDRMVSDAPGVLAYSMAHGRLALSASKPARALEELAMIRERVTRESISRRTLTDGSRSS
ncbi:helix-turn-helix domain-containing protein [Nonomuraea sp. MG754425]|uniref:helix-turn-helix domain-containing protein n=1 Tax=Nonomuraea sp. MG754425 TaxID=2570319 RepID=UPI001F1FA828|nr:helix-turn-helix transcriptional regulator [Nonomuraea sp. MG754425]MCF6467331.1 helix-turn-helix domain-containing protein [Nonomuraea sp. MG754425]